MFLVTGGAGFVGSHLAVALLDGGHDVRVVDNLTTGLRANVPAGAEFIEGDLTDPATAVAATAGCEIVLHQAAVASVPLSISEPRITHDANINGTFNVLMAARDAGVRRVVFAASSAVYGNAPELPKAEDMPVEPCSPYALQKLVGESYCQLFTQLYGLETVALRYFNVFGPRQHPSSPYSGVLSLFIRAALSGEAATMYGDGEQTRDFTYIDDIVNGVTRAVFAPGISGEVINIATGASISLNEAWATLVRIVGPLPAPSYGPPREGDVRHSRADIAKGQRLLGYRPRVSFETGLRHTVEWAQRARAT